MPVAGVIPMVPDLRIQDEDAAELRRRDGQETQPQMARCVQPWSDFHASPISTTSRPSSVAVCASTT